MVTHEPDDKKYVGRVIVLSDGLIDNKETIHKRNRPIINGKAKNI
jgi:hypothetical protein